MLEISQSVKRLEQGLEAIGYQSGNNLRCVLCSSGWSMA